MYRRSAGFFACALGASALILPPGIAPASNDNDGPLPSIVNPKSQLIQLPCPACAFSSNEESVEDKKDFDDLFWIQGGANDVVLDFSVSDDGLALQLDGHAIYAPSSQSNALLRGERIHVLQVPASSSHDESDEARKISLEITSLGLSTEAEVRASPEGEMIVQLQLHVMGLQGVFMQLDGVRIHLLKTKAGELLILRLDIVPDKTFNPLSGWPDSSSSPPTSDVSNAKECNGLPIAFCKFRDMVEDKIESFRSGHYEHPPFGDSDGLPPLHINPHNLDFDSPPPHRHGRPHHFRPHGEYDHHHGPPDFHSLTRSVISILIPVMAGITVGLLVSLLGLLVGRIIGFLWLRLYPNKRRKQSRHRHRRDYSRVEEGKIMLYDDGPEPLPLYEDAPAYEEIETRPT